MQVRKRRTKPLDTGVAVLMVSVWLSNAGLITAAVFVFMNWGAIDWITGSTDWSIVLMVVCAVGLFYVLLSGCCILGFRQHVERSYLSLRTSPVCRLLTVFLAPVLILGMLLTLSVLALADTDVSTKYIHAHSNEVFHRAANGTSVTSLDYYQFRAYMMSLPQFQGKETDDGTNRRLLNIFDAMSRGKSYITSDDMFFGVLEALRPMRRDLGISMAACAGILVFFFLVYLIWYTKLRSSKFEEQLRTLKTQASLHRSGAGGAGRSSSASGAGQGYDDADFDDEFGLRGQDDVDPSSEMSGISTALRR